MAPTPLSHMVIHCQHRRTNMIGSPLARTGNPRFIRVHRRSADADFEEAVAQERRVGKQAAHKSQPTIHTGITTTDASSATYENEHSRGTLVAGLASR